MGSRRRRGPAASTPRPDCRHQSGLIGHPLARHRGLPSSQLSDTKLVASGQDHRRGGGDHQAPAGRPARGNKLLSGPAEQDARIVRLRPATHPGTLGAVTLQRSGPNSARTVAHAALGISGSPSRPRLRSAHGWVVSQCSFAQTSRSARSVTQSLVSLLSGTSYRLVTYSYCPNRATWLRMVSSGYGTEHQLANSLHASS